MLFAASGAFIAVLAAALYAEWYYALLLPAVMLVLWATFFKLEYLWFFVVAATPLSINQEELEIGAVGVALPTEPLLLGILIVLIMKTLTGRSIDKRIWTHPMAKLIYAYLVWMALTIITSELPWVSFKYMLARTWFIAACFFLAAHVFRDLRNIRLYFLLYLFPLCIVVIYTVFGHAQYGFDKDSSHWVMEPFFKDHTSYGAVLAMYFVINVALLLRRKMNLLLRVMLSISFLIITIGLVLSYTRAAWISVIGAALLLIVMLLRVKFRTILMVLPIAGALLYVSWEDIQVSLERNKQESSDKLEEHVGSISNVSSDASNLERLNRWNCAWEMFKERPVTGWGPGTYQFVYAPFQRASDRTIISTNQGNGGNAHSEYLGPLCEQGIPGFLLVIALLLTVSGLAFRLFYAIHSHDVRLMIGGAYLGLITYFIHGVLNNYLDLDKASIPFWGFLAVLVAIDLYHREQPKPGT
jgi:putative inorganic carbon (hco3(-)) transporter